MQMIKQRGSIFGKWEPVTNRDASTSALWRPKVMKRLYARKQGQGRASAVTLAAVACAMRHRAQPGYKDVREQSFAAPLMSVSRGGDTTEECPPLPPPP